MYYKTAGLKYFAKTHLKAPVPKPFFDKMAGLKALTLLKRKLRHSYFSVNFSKFSRAAFLLDLKSFFFYSRKKRFGVSLLLLSIKL